MTNKHSFPPRFMSIVLFWGSLWGLGEATLGHLLHIFGVPGLAGFVLFPLGLFFMIQAYAATGRRAAIWSMALVACSIKMADFFLPAPTPFTVINPCLAILLESLAVMLLLPARGLSQRHLSFFRLWFVSGAWRMGYALCVWVIAQIFPAQSFLDLGPGRVLQFLVLESQNSNPREE